MDLQIIGFTDSDLVMIRKALELYSKYEDDKHSSLGNIAQISLEMPGLPKELTSKIETMVREKAREARYDHDTKTEQLITLQYKLVQFKRLLAQKPMTKEEYDARNVKETPAETPVSPE